MIGRVEVPAASRTCNGSAAHRRGSGHRSKNTRAAVTSRRCFRVRSAQVVQIGACRSRLGLGTDAIASGIELGFHVGRSQMDVTGGGVDMGMTEQRLHHREIDPGLGQRGPERVSQGMGMPADRSR